MKNERQYIIIIRKGNKLKEDYEECDKNKTKSSKLY